jgi:NAD(P)-dependent dehydrogenase (short-subunit alcohol dehydrogenase family)
VLLDRVIGINLKASVNVSQVVAKKMIHAGKGGSIVNVTSIVRELWN